MFLRLGRGEVQVGFQEGVGEDGLDGVAGKLVFGFVILQAFVARLGRTLFVVILVVAVALVGVVVFELVILVEVVLVFVEVFVLVVTFFLLRRLFFRAATG